MRASQRRATTLPPAPGLIAADAVALIVFVLIGMDQHHASTIAVLIRNAVPLLTAWFVVAWLLHLYRLPGLAPLLRTWLVAVPLGVVVRSLIVGSPDGAGPFLMFLTVAMAFTLAFLLIGRAAVRFVSGWRRDRTGDRKVGG